MAWKLWNIALFVGFLGISFVALALDIAGVVIGLLLAIRPLNAAMTTIRKYEEQLRIVGNTFKKSKERK